MKTRIGVVGPQDSVKTILEVAKEFSDRIIWVPFIYTNLNETRDIISEEKDKVDVWLFSGQAPFALAPKDQKFKNSFFPKLNGSSLTKVLLDISYKDHKGLRNLSFDTISTNEIYETFTELELPKDDLKSFPYIGYKPTQELVEFHYNLYKDGKVESCITGVHSVFKVLTQLGVPAYRIKPTKMAIRQTISMACQTSETIHFKKAQISILIIQIYEMNKLIGDNNISYNAHRLNFKLQGIVIDFTEKMSGSYIQLESGKFMIFSTRGAFENHNKNKISTLLEKNSIITGLPANIGIGYGITALEAEQNAYLALNHAKNSGENTTILVDENGVIEGPLEDQNSLSFSYRIGDKIIIEKLKQSGVSISTFNKIISIQNSLRHDISAVNVAEWLNMTVRNARRILSNLEKEKLAEVVGVETPNTRGRPRKLYRVGALKEDGQDN